MSQPRLRAKPERTLQPVLATPRSLKRRLSLGLANTAPNAASYPRPERQDRGSELEKQPGNGLLASVSGLSAALFFAGFRNLIPGLELCFHTPHPMGTCPMPEQSKRRAVKQATQARASAREAHVFGLGERWLCPADKLDYLIRRWAIPDHPFDIDRAFPTAPPPQRPWRTNIRGN